MIAASCELDDLAMKLDDEGVIVLDSATDFFSVDEWHALAELAECLPYESVYIGDAGEPNLVEVGRLMTDVEAPKVVNPQISEKMLEIIRAPQRLAFLERLLGESNLTIRRAQVNRMHSGSFIGCHLDQDSNPDYEVSVVLQFGTDFEGGEFVVHLPDGRATVIKPSFRSATITRCDLPHEVKLVADGVRTSLVYFASRHAGNNKRYSRSA